MISITRRVSCVLEYTNRCLTAHLMWLQLTVITEQSRCHLAFISISRCRPLSCGATLLKREAGSLPSWHLSVSFCWGKSWCVIKQAETA